MNNQATLDQMRQLSLSGMAQAFETIISLPADKQLTSDQLVAHLIHAEQEHRQHRKMQTAIKQAKFRYQSAVEEIEYQPERNLDKNLMLRLADTSFITRSENVLITGATGCGKSFIATALGYQACQMGLRVAYYSLPKLLQKLHLAKADGSYAKELARLERMHLLILDDWGLQPLDNHAKMAIMQIIEDRHAKSATIITSQLPINKWYDYLAESTLGDAIMDRILQHANRIELKGQSMRVRMTMQQNQV
ncbi:IS21-like element helper ATPase IstB [Dyadobacter psychrotolerans]|jgi:DNA replication protein DnaC|uniref:ATP-binding protein n=1 Tax=Dyadobacter psychrotolerans TaxID=2541721 RepID=A0A4V2Z2L9_9BACT|nr:IS21-like element helper ATPase IstB [Dyadobacter psychrotolerans]TDE09378.1 ATP-binding protein [Dyadobacter psychrotolerans]